MKQFVILHLNVQQLVEKGWCNESASTIDLNCNEIFTKELPKNLKDFGNKRQVKDTSTVLEPSIPFHPKVKLVDTEDIANHKIRTHNLTLEVKNITKQLQTQTLDSSQQEQLMFTQPRNPNNKNKQVSDEEDVQPRQSFTETSAPLLTFPTLIDTLRNFSLFISHIGKADVSECIPERKPPEVNENCSEARVLNFTIPPCRRKGSKCRSSTVTEKPNLQTTKSRKGLRN